MKKIKVDPQQPTRINLDETVPLSSRATRFGGASPFIETDAIDLEDSKIKNSEEDEEEQKQVPSKTCTSVVVNFFSLLIPSLRPKPYTQVTSNNHSDLELSSTGQIRNDNELENQYEEEKDEIKVSSVQQSSRSSYDISRLPRWIYTRIPYFSLVGEGIFQYFFIIGAAKGMGSFLIDWTIMTPAIDPTTGKDSLTEVQNAVAQNLIYISAILTTLAFNAGVDFFGINGPNQRHAFESEWDEKSTEGFCQKITSLGKPLPPAVEIVDEKLSSKEIRAKLRQRKTTNSKAKNYLIANNKIYTLDPLDRLRIQNVPGLPDNLNDKLETQYEDKLAKEGCLTRSSRVLSLVAAHTLFELNNLFLSSSDGIAIIDWSNPSIASRAFAAIGAVGFTILGRYYYKFFLERRIKPHLEFLANCAVDTVKGTGKLIQEICHGNLGAVWETLKQAPIPIDIARVFLITAAYRSFLGLFTVSMLNDQIEDYYHVNFNQIKNPLMLTSAISVFGATIFNRLLSVVQKYSSGDIDDLEEKDLIAAKKSLGKGEVITKVVLPNAFFAGGLGGLLALRGQPIAGATLATVLFLTGNYASYKSLVATTAIKASIPEQQSNCFASTIVFGSMFMRAFVLFNATLNSVERFTHSNLGVGFTRGQYLFNTGIEQVALEKLCLILAVGAPIFMCERHNYEEDVIENSKDLADKYKAERRECSEVPSLLSCRGTLLGGPAPVHVAIWNAATKAKAEYDNGYKNRQFTH